MNDKETLEEAAEKFRSENPGTMQGGNNTKILNAFKNGAKWQQERSYSDEDMISLLEFNYKKETNGLGTLRKDYSQKIIKEWFEQFKKK